jgi:DNA-binding protein
MRSKDFPTAPLERIAKKACGKRISKEAMKIMRDYVLDDAQERAREISELARHSGRKTVLRQDVEFITKRNLPI